MAALNPQAYNVQNITQQFNNKMNNSPPVANALGCLRATNWTRKDQTCDYRMLALGTRKCQIGAHVAAWIAANGQMVPGNVQVSHLCHDGSCVAANHLILETDAQNRHRNLCNGWTRIPCQCCGNANHLINPCQHVPQCILP